MSHDWKNILVSPSSSVQAVLKIIDREALQLALVVDTENRLLGTVTDGDIRRALINDVPLTEAVSKVMFTTPTTVNLGTSKATILELMSVKQLHSIPILDNGIVVGLKTIQNINQKDKYDNPVFLMAGGFGTRLKPLTDNCPKPLLKVGDKPILETVLLSFIKAGFHQFYISTHYLPKLIEEHFRDGRKWGVSIKYVHEESPLGTGGALGLLPKSLPDLPLIMMNGDVLTTINIEKLLHFHNKRNGVATMCVREYEYQVPFGVVESNGTKLISMTEKPLHRYHVNAGIYVVEPKIFKNVEINEIVDMPTLLERYVDNDVHTYTFHDYWLDIGRIDDFNRAQVDINRLEML